MGSVKASINMQTVFGWWDWDAEALGMVNRVTGERVVYLGRAREEVLLPDRETWLRFDYLHSELTFPLLVQEVPGREWSDGDKTAWQLDYRQSAALWRRETGTSELHPSYGIWRRVDDCVSDALACWPENEITIGSLAANVHLDGGWLNGAWRGEAKRAESRLMIHDRLDPDEHDYSPWLIPLDTPPPSPFVFHDYRPARPEDNKRILENPVLLKSLTFGDSEWRFNPKLPPDAPLTQLEGRTAYLLSQDQHRLLYIYFGDTERQRKGGHWSPLFKLLYIDDRVVVPGPASPGQQSETGAMWSTSPFLSGFELRSDKPDSAFTVQPRADFPPRPSRALWLHIRWGIAEGWCAWDGSEARHTDWLGRLSLRRADGIRLANGGYRGGRWATPADLIVRR